MKLIISTFFCLISQNSISQNSQFVSEYYSYKAYADSSDTKWASLEVLIKNDYTNKMTIFYTAPMDTIRWTSEWISIKPSNNSHLISSEKCNAITKEGKECTIQVDLADKKPAGYSAIMYFSYKKYRLAYKGYFTP